ncbi:MAG: AAA family ATPase [Elusimicrobia bacterium]|nr:AAA family ATPase [Elusimicrobiota bacterium]
MIIAVSGKGGVGKSTISSLIIKQLVESKKFPVLAVDADPNSNLGYYLGIDCPAGIAVSDLREDEFKKNPAGISKVDWLNIKMQECIFETAKDFDLLVMGRPEGPGCYCAVNNLLRDFLKKISRQYPFVVIDNEAGMEHLSRRTNNEIDVLFIVVEPTNISFLAAENIKKTAQQLPIKIKKKYIVVNKYQNEKVKNIEGLDMIGYIRYNKNVSDNFDPVRDTVSRCDISNRVDADNSEIKNDIQKILLKSGIL